MSIAVERLNVSFNGRQVLRDLSLTLPDSGVVCIYGPSGSGKTTLFNCLAGVIKPDSGAIRGLEGKRLAMVFQENRLLPWYNALENVAFAVEGDREKALRALAAMELAAEAEKLPAQLSGGMQRRVAIARALAYGGDILMLDEPTAGLDKELAERVVSRLIEAWRGRLILLITHDLWLAERFATFKYGLESIADAKPDDQQGLRPVL
ncbi:MAG: ATP-binding cassette domain-containing protein [Clostridia bacterium]|nr:ATP-binding cassette domain-containing protein [Clostridia bacterium]